MVNWPSFHCCRLLHSLVMEHVCVGHFSDTSCGQYQLLSMPDTSEPEVFCRYIFHNTSNYVAQSGSWQMFLCLPAPCRASPTYLEAPTQTPLQTSRPTNEDGKPASRFTQGPLQLVMD
ncbi:hypothetical protein AMECASPLE_022130 [Ameca splendens]|uniref:Uncharacterized protein n=1 Tax=Ameca splendens TaxID=208324 RepID=A0ABV0ZF15_9TELE